MDVTINSQGVAGIPVTHWVVTAQVGNDERSMDIEYSDDLVYQDTGLLKAEYIMGALMQLGVVNVVYE